MSDFSDPAGVTDAVTVTVKGPDPAVWGDDSTRPAPMAAGEPPHVGPVLDEHGEPVLDGNGDPVTVKGPDPAVWGV
jgi:hypothetical protein